MLFPGKCQQRICRFGVCRVHVDCKKTGTVTLKGLCENEQGCFGFGGGVGGGVESV